VEREVDVARTMRRIRESVRQAGSEESVASTSLNDFVPADRQLGLILARLEAHQRDVQRNAMIDEPPFISIVPIVGPLIVRFRRLWNRAMVWYVRLIVRHQSSFNLAVARRLEDQLLYSKALAMQLESVCSTLRRVQTQRVSRNAVLSNVVGSSEDLTVLPVNSLQFNELFTGDESTLDQLYSPYLQYFQGAERVLDLGCGRGAFVKLLAREGIGGYGVDSDPRMVVACRERGLDVRQEDALDHLRHLGDETLGGIFAGHMIEHLSVGELVQFSRLCCRKLVPGQYLVCETPNASSMYVLSRTFFRDPTNMLPLHPETYEFLVRSQGFQEVRLVYSNPVPEELTLAKLTSSPDLGMPLGDSVFTLNQNTAKANEMLFGYQNVAIIARK
jgi:SAM-dependent methyltransferase